MCAFFFIFSFVTTSISLGNAARRRREENMVAGLTRNLWDGTGEGDYAGRNRDRKKKKKESTASEILHNPFSLFP